MLLYHVTPHAEEILRAGFRNGSGSYGLPHDYEGVFLSDQIVDSGEARGAVLEVEFPDGFSLDYWEWSEEGPDGWRREWCVPATIINSLATVRPGPPNPWI